MNIRTETRERYSDDEEGNETVRTVERQIMRIEVNDPNRTVVRVGVDDRGEFTRDELHIDYEDHVVGSSEGDDDRYHPIEFVTWKGAVVRAILTSTDAVWATGATWEEREAAVDEAHTEWMSYILQTPEFQAQWSFASYAEGLHRPAFGE